MRTPAIARTLSTRLVLPALLTIGLAACSASDPAATTNTTPEANSTQETNSTQEATGAGPLSVVVTTSILGSVVGDIVACADPASTVTVLMPPGTDPHDFSASSAQVAEMVNATLVVANGLGLEQGLTSALDSATADGATVLSVGEMLDPIPFGEHDEHSAEDEHSHGSEDPHFWFDMTRMATAAELIGQQLAQTGGQAYADCGTKTADALRAAEAGIRTTLESVPSDKRVLITDHEALGYLADTYGYQIAGTVIPAGTTLAEPSSADLAALVATIRSEGINVIFSNSSNPTVLSEAVAREAGTGVEVVELFVESLGAPGSGADTYSTMMQTNAERIASALKN